MESRTRLTLSCSVSSYCAPPLRFSLCVSPEGVILLSLPGGQHARGPAAGAGGWGPPASHLTGLFTPTRSWSSELQAAGKLRPSVSVASVSPRVPPGLRPGGGGGLGGHVLEFTGRGGGLRVFIALLELTAAVTK